MIRKLSDAVIEADLRKLLGQGWHLVILCREVPDFRHGQCYSEWVMRIARPDGGEEYPLVLGRPPFEERRFSTLTTLGKFLTKHRFATAEVPFQAGMRTVNIPVAVRSAD